jgi:hypothetical protein
MYIYRRKQSSTLKEAHDGGLGDVAQAVQAYHQNVYNNPLSSGGAAEQAGGDPVPSLKIKLDTESKV